MKTIALTTAALLVAAGSAFAASDHFQGPSTQSSIDSAYTASIGDNDKSVQKPVAEGNVRLTVGNH
ncbi:MAG TPA: hypothetical protein VGM46_04925 [Mesorhizobium sp.]|jgi:hypothetical protein